MTDSPVLKKVGLTRPQVLHLTRDMRLPFDDIRGPEEEVQPYLLRMITTWRSIRVMKLARMALITPGHLGRAIREMEDNGWPVTIEMIDDGVSTAGFACIPSLKTEQGKL